MKSQKSDNSLIAKKAQKILAELDCKMPLGRVYEFLSRLSDEPSWNAAAAKGTSFAPLVEKSSDFDAYEVTVPGSGTIFEAKIKADAEIRKFYRYPAKDEAEAKAIIKEYIDVQSGEIEVSDVKHKVTHDLLKLEPDNEFTYQNWELPCGAESIRFSEIQDYSAILKLREKLLLAFPVFIE